MTDTAQAILRASGLTLGYGRKDVLRNVSFEVDCGAWWFIVGPNGEGKTTLLRAILGLLKPKAGELWRDPQAAAPHRIGFVPQRCDMNPALPTTVAEFVSLGAIGQPLARRQRRQQLETALTTVGLASKMTADYWSLSGGQRQRVLLARALIRQPSLLLLDEPANGLDLPAESAFMQALAKLNREQKVTLIFVTHNVRLALAHGHQLALVHQGSVTTASADSMPGLPQFATAYGRDIATSLEQRHAAEAAL